MINNNKRGEGELQSFMISVVLVAIISVGMLSFITGAANGYGVVITNSTAFSEFQDSYDSLDNTTSQLSDDLTNAKNLYEIVGSFITGGYKTLMTLLTSVPELMNTILVNGLNAVGLGDYAPFAWTIVFIIVLFSIITLVMKVRG